MDEDYYYLETDEDNLKKKKAQQQHHNNDNIIKTTSTTTTAILRQSSTITGSDYLYNDDDDDDDVDHDVDHDDDGHPTRIKQQLHPITTTTGNFVIGSVVDLNNTTTTRSSDGLRSSDQSNDDIITYDDDDDDDDDDNIVVGVNEGQQHHYYHNNDDDDDDNDDDHHHDEELVVSVNVVTAENNNRVNNNSKIRGDVRSSSSNKGRRRKLNDINIPTTKRPQQHQQQQQQQQEHEEEQQQQEQEEQRHRLIESLVSFSCHTPNVVLEDLINHEIIGLSSITTSTSYGDNQKLYHHGTTNISVTTTTGITIQDPTRPVEKNEEETMDLVDDNDDDVDDDDDESSVSSLSSDGRDNIDRSHRNNDVSFDESDTTTTTTTRLVDETTSRLDPSTNNVRSKLMSTTTTVQLPTSRQRESCLLFVDITGFTKLSTVLDAETLSRTINSYFDMIIDEVNVHGGDVLKFAGDALFVEWRVQDDEYTEKKDEDVVVVDDNNDRLADIASTTTPSWALRMLKMSLSSMHHDNSEVLPRSEQLSLAILRASLCAASIVRKYSDHEVAIPSNAAAFGSEPNSTGPDSVGVLNVHCGIGSGRLIGFHVRDCQEGNSGLDRDGQEDNNVELRREYLFLGDAIDQASRAAHAATDGEVLISPGTLKALSACCDVPDEMLTSPEPTRIASRATMFLNLEPSKSTLISRLDSYKVSAVPIQEHLRRYCRRLNRHSLSRLHRQAALYVHPVVRGDILSAANVSSPVTRSDGQMKQRHCMEAELRSVYTMFIKAIVNPNLSGDAKIDNFLFMTLRDIMQLTSRELDRYSGQIRQFIVDDKGVVLIAVFGLRGSTFPNLVANNALPASFAIHRVLQGRGIDCRIGATFGKVYCGVVGGVRRHEYSVMGAPVNLAARLMDSANNHGILVDENVTNQAKGRFAFRSLAPITAKGYERPVVVSEPLHAIETKSVRTSSFVGRQSERGVILGIANEILDNPFNPQTTVITLIGEISIGKSSLVNSVMNEIKANCCRRQRHLVSLRSISAEDQQRIPLSAFRKVLLGAIRELCVQDKSFMFQSDGLNTLEEEKDGLDSAFSPPLSRLVPERNLFTAPKAGPRSRDIVFESPKIDSFVSMRKPSSVDAKRNLSHPTMPNADERMPHTDYRHGQDPYLEKLRFACVESGFHEQYADYVASQFLSLRNAQPITHVNGRVPSVNDLVECVVQAFIRIVDFADITTIFIDDFQWADSITLKVIRALGQSGKKMLLVCASRSHDKQAMRRIATELPFRLEITLGPLELPDIRSLIVSILDVPNDDSIDENICTEIYQKTGGLPVHIIELLESVKRRKAYTVEHDGKLVLALGGDLSKNGEENNASILKESLLNRFDALDSPVRKVLHTCAVLGNSFSLSDLTRVHPEIDVFSLKDALSVALSEMILVEIVEDDEKSVNSTSTAGSALKLGSSVAAFSKIPSEVPTNGDRNYEFSHDMWRSTVLATMLKGRKTELHRRIAIAMEKDRVRILERSDLAGLLSLFEHWKACGEFLKAAPLAMTVGTRLNEWDLLQQSVDLFRDALDMSLGNVQPVDKAWRPDHDDWVQVSSSPEVLILIIRLHIRIAKNQRKLEDMEQCIKTYQDAYTILSSSSGSSRALMIPVLSGLCDANLEKDPNNDQLSLEQESLIKQFVTVATEEGNPLHLSRALAMEAGFFAQQGQFEKALDVQRRLLEVYIAKEHSHRLVKRYQKDFAMEAISQSIIWFFLVGKQEEAIQQAMFVIKNHLPLQDPHDVDSIMALLLPAILVIKFAGRGKDALYILGKYVVNAHHDHAPCEAQYWVELFNPLIYLLKIVIMEEDDVYQIDLLDDIQSWVLEEANSYYSPDHLRLGHTVMGEICFRLGHLKQVDDPLRPPLMHKARSFLTPVARDVHSEPFLAHTALSYLRAIG